MYWRFATGLRRFLKEPLTLEQSRAIIRQRLADRDKSLLTIVKRAIYENENSPYLNLLKLAGCEYGDFERMVRIHGIEPTLRKLCDEGVYLSIEEFKGRKEAVRGGKTFRFNETDFDNPLMLRHLEFSSSGTRSAGTRTIFDFDYLAMGRAVYTITLLDAYGALNVPLAIWGSIMPGWGPRHALDHAKIGKPLTKWFSPVDSRSFNASIKDTLGTNYIVYMSNFWGVKTPTPEYVPMDEAWRVAQWIADTINREGGCYISTNTSNAVRICQALKQRGLDINRTKFLVVAEPLTRKKRQEIEASGANVCARYTFIEGGHVGQGCLNPAAPDDLHFLRDKLALIQHDREVVHAGVSVDAFLFTSLLLSAPKVLLNVESGDYGVIEDRSCGCYFDELGFTNHIYDIRSFDKLTSAGMTFLGTDLIRVIEEVLPAKFGGTSVDYQMVEEENEEGLTRISVIVSPEVGAIYEDELIQTVLHELGKGKDAQWMMAKVWSQARTLRLKRMRPLTTAGGKLLPLHIQKRK